MTPFVNARITGNREALAERMMYKQKNTKKQ